MERIQLRRDLSTKWVEINPILMEGEVGFETDTKLRKIGNGVTAWNNLEYLAAENIVQELGDSENATVSQKAITDNIFNVYGSTYRYKGGINKTTGNSGGIENFVYTDYIPLTKYSISYIKAWNSENLTPCAFYDKDKNFISSLSFEEEGMVEIHLNSSNIPENTSYIRSTGSSFYSNMLQICSSDLVYQMLKDNDNLIDAINNKSFKRISILNASSDSCISIDTTTNVINIPKGLIIFIQEDDSFKNSIEQSININYPLSTNKLIYNKEDNTFSLVRYSEDISYNSNILLVGYLRISSSEFTGNIAGYKINGIYFSNQIRTYSSFNYNPITDYEVPTTKAVTKYIGNNQNKLVFFEWNNSLTTTQNNLLAAIKYLKIHVNNININHIYSLQRLYTGTSTLVAFYIRDIDGTNLGQTLSITESDKVPITDTLWYAKKPFVDGSELEIIVDDSLITSNFGSTSNGFNVLRNCYVLKNSIVENTKYIGKLYCNLGASSSGYPWHPAAVSKLGATWKTYNVGGSSWRVPSTDTVLDYSDTPIAANRTMMNQVARLLKDNTDSGYYPDSITLMCSLGDANLSAQYNFGTMGTLEDALHVELGNTTPETWFDLPDDIKRNTAKTIAYCILMLTNRFPYTQLILATNYAVNNANYPTDQLEIVNNLLRDIGARFGIPVIDFFKECGINDLTNTYTTYLKDDMLHPNNAGDILLANYAELKLRKVISYRK